MQTETHSIAESRDGIHLLTKPEIARRYQVSIRTIDYWMAARKIPVVRISKGIIRFEKTKCDAAIARFAVQAIASNGGNDENL